MTDPAMREMIKQLVRKRIVTEEKVKECLGGLPKGDSQVAAFLNRMAEHNYLTPLQIERIKLMDYDSLVLGGNKLLYENAAGSFARVYRAEKIDTGEMICLKILRQRWAEDPDTVTLFKREAEMGKKLKHANIVPIYKIGFEDGSHFFTMEFIEGGNLKDFIRIRGKLIPREAIRYALDISKGLEYALALGFTHRDLKTTNVLLSSQGVAKLIDFGLASDEDDSKKQSDAQVNALEYNTLEKGTGAPRNDPRSDLFFLGVILYELLSGHAPYESTKDRNERKRIGRYTAIRPVELVERSLPKFVTDVVDRLIHANPNERYQTPTEAVRALQEVLGRLGETPPAISIPKTSQKLAGMGGSHMESANGSNDSQSIAAAALAKPAKSNVSVDDFFDDLVNDLTQPQDSKKEIANDSDAGEHKHTGQESPVLLCIEGRSREQKILKDYFTKHGYNVVLEKSLEHALKQLKKSPPACVMLMGEGLDQEHLWPVYKKVAHAAKEAQCPLTVIVGRNQVSTEYPTFTQTHASLLYQPLTLREMRYEVQRLLGILETSDQSGS
jgi:serine/threonine protein kinase